MMKKSNVFIWALFLVLSSVSFTACSEKETPEPGPDPLDGAHFDLWVSLDGSGGMGSDATILVKNLKSLEEQSVIDFINEGADVTAKLYQESIIKGQYYYQIPKEKDRFGKYQITGNKITTVAECPFQANTYKDRRYTHAWIDGNTFVVLAANGKGDKVIWTKINAGNMTILSEGTLDLDIPEGDVFSTSGLARYRKSDGKIIYAFQHKKETKHFYVTFINAKDMSIAKTVTEDRAEQMAGTAYGELLQDKMFFDENENLYIACNSHIPGGKKSTYQFGRLLRINKGAMDFDKTYEGFKYDRGKIVTADFLTANKALLYIQDPEYTGLGPDAWGNNYNCYYAILDLTNDKKEEIKYNGTNLPFCSGTFSQRSVVLGNKAYIGVNPEHGNPCIYTYDTKTGDVTKGTEISEGYEFNRIVTLED